MVTTAIILLGSFAALHREVAPLLIPNRTKASETADGTYFRRSKPIGQHACDRLTQTPL
ncbi:uncharacterized protein METZ01_LOCUS271433 [marine metagenome]|uniref:Uncharacterized protein n=1 Tax=marine metagenome TaxID=408172 RepID=A0A382K351_9ZZZZ